MPRHKYSRRKAIKDILWVAGRIPDENGNYQIRFRTMGNSMIMTIPVPVKEALDVAPGDLAELQIVDGYLIVSKIDGSSSSSSGGGSSSSSGTGTGNEEDNDNPE